MQQTGMRMENHQQVRMPNDLYLATCDDQISAGSARTANRMFDAAAEKPNTRHDPIEAVRLADVKHVYRGQDRYRGSNGPQNSDQQLS